MSFIKNKKIIKKKIYTICDDFDNSLKKIKVFLANN